jgi:hypothetical protein
MELLQEVNKTPFTQEPVKLDIFQHMRIGIKNKEDNCSCENDINKLFYCIPCKVSCCDKCSIGEHASHLLINKNKFFLNQSQINNSFKAYEQMISNDDLYKNMQQKRTELINEIDSTCKKIEQLLSDWKQNKIKEINELFDDLITNIKENEQKKSEAKKLLNNFGTKHKTFFGYRDKNKDPHNTIFLINYDLISIPYMWSHEMTKIGKSIELNMKNYETREQNKNNQIINKIKDILFSEDDEDPLTHEKIDQKFLPIVQLKVDINNFNPENLKDIDKRLAKFNKGIESFKNSVLNSISKHGNYKELSKENNIYEHRKVKGADNLFSQRKMDTLSKGDENYLIPSHSINNKNDVILDNQILIRNFAHVITDLYDQYFRIPTIELQSSHADLQIKKKDEDSEDDNDIAKIIEGTNEIQIYEKRNKKMVKYFVKLNKNPIGYTKFPLGCRSILIGDKLYISGGRDEYSEYPNVLIFDRRTQNLKRIMDLRVPRSYHTMVYSKVFNTILILGGEGESSAEIFDPVTNRWQLLPELNIPRANLIFHCDSPRGILYAMFGNEGSILDNKYSDAIEFLDLKNIKEGWNILDYKNKSEIDLKSLMNIYPLNTDLILLYGGVVFRGTSKSVCIFNITKSEITKIDAKILEALRMEAKKSKKLSTIISGLTSKASSGIISSTSSKADF